MYYYGGGGNYGPPRGRPTKVYLIIAGISIIFGAINEVFGVLFLIFACYLAWVSS